MRVEAGVASEPAPAEPLDYEAHAEGLREAWGEDFTVIVEKPFVMVGDESARAVQRRAQGTVRWAVGLLKQDYFEHDPDHIITIYLFKDKDSYEKNTRRIAGKAPHTPYGYYSRSGRYMAMNIATGGGTLVHEIVHPFVAANFSGCPAWFNEGLGSLYEQCAERDGRIIGQTNWRLKGLQQDIRDENLPTFKQLAHTTDDAFYGDGSGTRYAMARYLCYYLQEQGKLRDYYHAFVQNQTDDPTGYITLTQILGDEGKDMDRFQKEWESWVMKLRFP